MGAVVLLTRSVYNGPLTLSINNLSGAKQNARYVSMSTAVLSLAVFGLG
jgi:hypothetical protein